jgi:hypothetical protein
MATARRRFGALSTVDDKHELGTEPQAKDMTIRTKLEGAVIGEMTCAQVTGPVHAQVSDRWGITGPEFPERLDRGDDNTDNDDVFRLGIWPRSALSPLRRVGHLARHSRGSSRLSGPPLPAWLGHGFAGVTAPDTEHSWTLNEMRGVRQGGWPVHGNMGYPIIRDDRPDRGPLRVRTLQYRYRLAVFNQEVFRLHRHLNGRDPVTYPHVHVALEPKDRMPGS